MYQDTYPRYSGDTRLPTQGTLGVPGYLPEGFSGGTRVLTRGALGVPTFLPEVLWGYPGFYPRCSGGTRVPTRGTLGVPGYLPENDRLYQVWYPGIPENIPYNTQPCQCFTPEDTTEANKNKHSSSNSNSFCCFVSVVYVHV